MPDPEDLAEAGRIRCRTAFVSDVHLGSGGCRAAELAAFLKRLDCETLFLVGDIIDMWRLRQRWYWPSSHNRVVRRLLRLAADGTRVVYIPGNHDEHARPYTGLNFGGIEIARDAEHLTAAGRLLYITHGDQFDLVVQHARLLSIVGSWAYDTLVVLNTRLNWARRRLGMPYWSLARFLKMRVKTAVNYIARFEGALIEEATQKGFQGVVCGHIHKAEIRRAHEPLPGPATDARGAPRPGIGIDYFNCGDWVESCTALLEGFDGTMVLVDGIEAVERLRRARRKARGGSIPPEPSGRVDAAQPGPGDDEPADGAQARVAERGGPSAE